LVDIAHYDHETKRILQLGVPITAGSVFESLFDAIAVALISRYLGVEALSAYVVTNLLIGLSDTLISGVGSALSTVCSHAIGADNYDLAGQYTQIATVLYVILAIPVLGVWWFVMDDFIRLFGMNERVVEIGVQYTKIVIFDYLFDGMFGTYSVLIYINGQATQSTIFGIITGALDCAATWLLCAFVEDVSLFWIGASMLSMSVLYHTGFTIFAIYKGWLDPFWNGMIKTFALKNIPAVKNVLKTAIPLSFGSLVSYGEVSFSSCTDITL